MAALFKKGVQRLRIYTAEKNEADGLPLYEWLVQQAVLNNMSGLTVFRALGGFCASNPIRTPALMNIKINRPVVIEIIDSPESIERYIKAVDKKIGHTLMTCEDIQYRYYGGKRKKTL